MNLAKTTLLSSINTFVRMAAGLLSVKAMAIFVGPSGVAYFGQFQSVLTLTNNLSNFGIGQGVIKYTAEYQNNAQELKKLFRTSTMVSLVASVLVSIFILLFAQTLSKQVFGHTNFTDVFYTLGIAVLFYAFNQILTSVLNGFRLIEKLVKAKIISAISGLIVTLIFIYFDGLRGAVYALIIAQGLGFTSLILLSKKQWWFNLKNFFGKADSKVTKALLGFSIVSLISLLLLHFRQLFLRDYLIENFSANEAGYWQAMWKISEVYLMVVTSALSMYYLPKLSQISDPKEIQFEIFKGFKTILPIVVGSSIVIYILRATVISILFTAEFSSITNLFLYQLIGDVLKIAAWLISFVMVAKAMTKAYLITEIIFISLFGILAVLLSKQAGAEGYTLAFAITYALYFITMLIMFKNLIFKNNPSL